MFKIKQKYFNRLFILVGSAAISCVDPFSTKTQRITENLVVEGSITNQDPPYSVILTKSANYSRYVDGVPRFVSGASVQVCDDEGNCIPFFEVTAGNYETAVNATRGEVGKTYHLEIITPEGDEIVSEPEKMNASPPILRTYFEYDQATVLQEGYKVYIDADDPADERNYYKWETESYFPYSERFCFTRVYERTVNYLASDKNVDGNIISRMPVKVVPLSSTSTYVVQIYQLAISAGAFEFFDAIKKQVGSSGSIFDPPPSFLRGNMTNTTNPGDAVLGYFVAAGASRIDIVVDRGIAGQIPRPGQVLAQEPVYCGYPCNPLCPGTCGDRPCPPDCANMPGKTNIAPDAWPYLHEECGY